MNDLTGLRVRSCRPGPLLALAMLAACVVQLGCPAPAGAQSIDLPEYSLEQRWERASLHVTLFFVTMVRREVDAGGSPESAGRALADLYGGNWNTPTPEAIARAMHMNWQIWPDAPFHVQSGSDGTVTITTAGPHRAHFGESGRLYGVTAQDLDVLFLTFHREVARRHGFGFEAGGEGDRLVFTIRPAP